MNADPQLTGVDAILRHIRHTWHRVPCEILVDWTRFEGFQVRKENHILVADAGEVDVWVRRRRAAQDGGSG
ncbi:MAG TPA: hypothetical protein ENK62_06635 [Chromatiales bacterium]|nr:hypothetical protein [Chromatiales bacterium]